MDLRTIALAAMTGTVLNGCGADGNGANPGSGMPYNYVAPAQNSTRAYSETVIDNAGNTINIGFTETITAVGAGGSFSQLSQSSTGNSSIVNGTNYALLTEDQNFNDLGQELNYTYTGPAGAEVDCSYTPHGGGPSWPVKVGQTWVADYQFACDSEIPVAYSQQGSVLDVESITVPAGTFSALKLQSTLTWTDLQGTTRVQTITNWRDIATLISVKEEITIAVSGALPATGYAVSRTDLLESIS